MSWASTSQNRIKPAKLPVTVELTIPSRKDSRLASKFAGQRIHFIGIGGSGMSGLANMLVDCGAIVSGSDSKPNQQTFDLIKRGVKISRDQIGELINDQLDLVVRSAAIKDDHMEMVVAVRNQITTVKYAKLLGMVMQERHGIAVAGTHGKSTTTAMTAFALTQCGQDPSFVVGGTVPQLGGGSHSGTGKAFVAEACEYDRSFHNLFPTVAIITNVEEDHLDCYKNINDIIESFRHFSKLVPSNGVIIANGRDANVAKAVMNVNCNVETVSIDGDTTWSIKPGALINGCHTGDVYYNGKLVANLRLAVPGEHNLLNATMALAACNACNVDIKQAAEALGRFIGVDRRMTVMGTYNGATVIDDYGHHPTEVRATLVALRERYNPSRLVCVFQPHQHSRTRCLMDDFAKSFAAADLTIMPDIYFVRDSEQERHSVSTKDLIGKIEANGHCALYIKEPQAIITHLKEYARPGDLIVTMGAGSLVWEIGRDLVG